MTTASSSKTSSTVESGSDPVRLRILSEARRHFMTHGFRNVTMDDLAAELGMSKKTVYAHFASKAVLLQAVIDEKFHSAEADFSAISDRFSSDFMEALQQLLACVRKHAEELQPPFLRRPLRGPCRRK